MSGAAEHSGGRRMTMGRKPERKVVTVNLPEVPGWSKGRHVADAVTNPINAAAVTIQAWTRHLIEGESMEVSDIIEALSDRAAAVKRNDLGGVETMLIAQAHQLDSMFAELTRRANLNLGEHLEAADRYVRLALKAQSQCRATLETLAAVKNPPIMFAKQANVGQNVQVNNGPTARTGQAGSVPNELLEHQHAERLDFGTKGTASGGDSSLAPVGTLNRTAD